MVCLGGEKLFMAEVNGEVGDNLCAGRKKGEVRHLTALLGWHYSDACVDTFVTRPVVTLATQRKTKKNKDRGPKPHWTSRRP